MLDSINSENYLAILVFAWSYILSTYWLEIQQSSSRPSSSLSAQVQYLSSQAPRNRDFGRDYVYIDIGRVDKPAA
jgi:hypothetical protein